MSGEMSGYNPSTNEVAVHAKKSAELAKVRRDEEKRKKSLKNRAALGAAGLAAAAAIGIGGKAAIADKSDLPDDRFTPERTASFSKEQNDAVGGILDKKMHEDFREYDERITAEESSAEKEEFGSLNSATHPELPQTNEGIEPKGD